MQGGIGQHGLNVGQGFLDVIGVSEADTRGVDGGGGILQHVALSHVEGDEVQRPVSLGGILGLGVFQRAVAESHLLRVQQPNTYSSVSATRRRTIPPYSLI